MLLAIFLQKFPKKYKKLIQLNFLLKKKLFGAEHYCNGGIYICNGRFQGHQ